MESIINHGYNLLKFMSEIKNTEQKIEKIFKEAQDFLPLLGTDYVEFYVGNLKTISFTILKLLLVFNHLLTRVLKQEAKM